MEKVVVSISTVSACGMGGGAVGLIGTIILWDQSISPC